MNVTSIPYSTIPVSGLTEINQYPVDDSNFIVNLPLPFLHKFLTVEYSSVNVSSNSYITFGSGGQPGRCCFGIPQDIPTTVALPGIFISTSSMDDYLYHLYTGFTVDQNGLIVKYQGTLCCPGGGPENITLEYNFIFYKNHPYIVDLIIEENNQFYNGDPTGGVSDGRSPDFLVTFNSSGGTAYRFDTSESPISANTAQDICFYCMSDINNGEVVIYTITPPRPSWTNNYGTEVIELNMITIGGNGLNA